MSWKPCPDASGTSAVTEAVEMVIVPRQSDIGGLKVARVLPFRRKRMVGPFIFMDQMGPNTFALGEALDVEPHPHIGLATATYLFSGEIFHRDSLGTAQAIRPGEVNWMTAGRGIAHSERTPSQRRQAGEEIFGMQTWVALPADQEEAEPSFAHHGSGDIPVINGKGVKGKVILGEAWGAVSPVATASATLYAEATLAPGSSLPLDPIQEERALFVVHGRVLLEGQEHCTGECLVLRPGAALTLRAVEASKVMYLGGEPLEGPRHIWWNFVSSSKERIRAAQSDWKEGRFTPVPEESPPLPLPKIPGP